MENLFTRAAKRYNRNTKKAALDPNKVQELRKYLRWALDYIDAIPKDVASRLPAMPGFDRDEAERILDETDPIH
jgi:hypothetical protein